MPCKGSGEETAPSPDRRHKKKRPAGINPPAAFVAPQCDWCSSEESLGQPGRRRREDRHQDQADNLNDHEGNDAAVDVHRRHRGGRNAAKIRAEEHTSELQSLMRISYAVSCLKKK